MTHLNKIRKTNFASFVIKGIPNGCRYCIRGEKLVLFVTGKCSTHCAYCPLSKLRKNSPKSWANEKECRSIEEVLEEAKESNAKGAGITGGDPLLVLNKTLKYASALKKHFGKMFHIHIYLSTKLVTKEKLKRLSEYIDEVRFHPDNLSNLTGHDKDIEKIKLASLFFKKQNMGIEIPIFPDKKKESVEFIKKVSPYISFVNLNELEIGDSNFNYILRKYEADKNGYTIKSSIDSGKWLMSQCIKNRLGLKVHLCTAETKNWYQYKNRLIKHKIMPFGRKTKEGTVIYYFISKQKNIPAFDGLRKKISSKEGYFDQSKQRIILNKKFLDKFSDFKISRSEEYPTYDRIEAESEDLN
jgi:uncharacterized protein